MDIIATYLAKEFLKRKLIKEDALEWCIYGIGKIGLLERLTVSFFIADKHRNHRTCVLCSVSTKE